jgi:cysteinyl-tRNA synthetase
MTSLNESVLDLIGNTPLVRITRLAPNPNVAIYAKLEGKNPGGSVKDRIARSMIEAAERSGELTRAKVVLEPTSGNTGIGMALVCAVKGHRLLLALPESVSVERRKILAALGAEFILTPGSKGTDGAIEMAYEMARDEPARFFMPDQYNNPANPLAHYLGTGVEIWEQTGGRVTHFVATMGTTGTLMGTGRRLKEYDPAVRVVGVEPVLGHKIQGLKNLKEAYVPGIFDKARLDEKVTIEDEEAYETARQLALREGIFVGMSAGAAVAVAIRKAREIERGLIVVILPDGGERYLSTTLFTGVSLAEKEHPVRGEIFLYNTLTRAKERFAPLAPGKVTMYTCGPTADGRAHLSLLRRAVHADLLSRLFAYRGLTVTHVMNVTDLDDRTIARSEAAGVPLQAFTRENERVFFEDLDALGVWRAAEYPRASEQVGEMVKLTQRLFDAGLAYEKHRSVYFDLTRFPEYGKLSQVDLEKIHVGRTVDLDDYEKENPRDFAVLKRASLEEWKKGLCVKTEWGNVRPGWHVECAAMATKFLGDRIDVHTSSIDLLFPHHDNEIALVEGLTGKRFVSVWSHGELVYVDGKKMAEAAGNAVTLPDCLAQGVSPRAVRLFLVATHYRRKLHFTGEALAQAAATLARIDAFVRRLAEAKGDADDPAVAEACERAREAFDDAILDDLRVSQGLAALFELTRQVNPRLAEHALSAADAGRVRDALTEFNRVLGVMTFDFSDEDSAIAALVAERDAARTAGDFARADRLRDDLAARGVTVEDTPDGTRWGRK